MPTNRLVSTLPTVNLDRRDDHVYHYTKSVVQAVRQLLQAAQEKRVESYLELVKNIGSELRGLLSSVDFLIPTLPSWSHREIEMAHKVLSRDMAFLIKDMRGAQKHHQTTVESEYTRAMLEKAHVLVVDAKTLLDVCDSVRIRISLSKSPPSTSQQPLAPQVTR